jgi:putrescine aminotransferase
VRGVIDTGAVPAVPVQRRAPDTRVDDDPRRLIQRYRRHLSRGRALLGQVSGGLVEIESSGCWVTASNGRRLLDAGGYGVFLHGHRHPVVVDAVARQLHRHPLATRVLLEPVSAAAAEALSGAAPAGLRHVHFVNSGAEATETALKLTRALGHETVIATHGGFHGKTMGALSLTGNPLYQDPFAPMLPGVEHVRYGDREQLAQALQRWGRRACVFLEPVQGEAGVVLPPPGYLTAVQELCREHGALFVLDEIQTGLGRTGRWWGGDHEGLTPDMMLVGKGLSGGVVPVAAVVATHEAYAPFDADPFVHSSTFAGSPLACAAALAAIQVIRDEGLPEKAAAIGARLLAAVREVLAARLGARLVDVRGQGLLIGCEFDDASTVGELVLELLQLGVVVNSSLNQHRVLRLTPPAVLTRDDEDFLVRALDRAASAVARRPSTSSPA